MAALLFKTTESLESRATEVKCPVMSNLEVLSFFDTSLGKSVRNLAPGKPDLTVVGAPSVTSTKVGITSNANYFQTSCAETAACTLIVVAKMTSAGTGTSTRPMLIGTYQDVASASGYGTNILAISTASGIQATAGLTDLSGARQNWLASPDVSPGMSPAITSWNFLYSIVNTTTIKAGTKTGTAVNKTDSDPNGTTYPRVVSGRNFRIGAVYNTSYGGTADIAFAAIYSAALTDANITSIHTWAKTILDSRLGVTL